MMQIISVVGAGGKTTFIEDFSKNISKHKDILISTTTKMRFPKISKYDYLILDSQDFENYKDYFSKHNVISKNIDKHIGKKYIVLKNRLLYFNMKFIFALSKDKIKSKNISQNQKYDKINLKKGKIYYFLKKISIQEINKKFMHIQDEDIEFFKKKFNCIILEADGAREKKLKFPKENEPVISSYSTKTVAMLDITMIGKEICEENIYNFEDFCSNLLDSENFKKFKPNYITLNILYRLVKNEKGIFKNAVGEKILCINKLNTKEDYENYQKLKHLLKDENIKVLCKKYKN